MGQDMKKSGQLFFEDLIKNKYHIYDSRNSETPEFYPEKLLEIIDDLSNYKTGFKIKLNDIYTVRAFFPISGPSENRVEFQSGYLDLKLIMKESEIYVGEVMTELPPLFVLKKGSKIKIKKSSILYKPDYNKKV